MAQRCATHLLALLLLCLGITLVGCGGDGNDTGASVPVDADSDGIAVAEGDCNDEDPAVHPDAEEVCDSVDNDCDGEVDEGLSVDLDGDGHSAEGSCGGTQDDCDDTEPAVNPSMVEVCDGVDQDCDSSVDEGVTSTFYRDGDGDGNGDPDSGTEGCTASAGYVANDADCNDGEPTVHPGAVELCDGVDQDCDSSVDEGLTIDADGDGYSSLGSCGGTRDDCDDADGGVHPGVQEECDGKDQDCDIAVDEDAERTYYEDADGDGYGNANSAKKDCTTPAGYVADGTDCKDDDPTVHPGAAELCDGVDQDCDSSVDEGVKSTFYRDSDGDGYGTPNSSTLACTAPAGFVVNATDCNDAQSTVHPGATETCDGVDQDCDASVDEGLTIDADGDGYSTASSCGGTRNDCNDADSGIHPAATEICDGKDQDCDSSVDEGVKRTFYRDKDRDGYGDPSSSTQTCTAPAGYVAKGTDCDDDESTIHPGATELCDGFDQDCDETVDEDACPTASEVVVSIDGGTDLWGFQFSIDYDEATVAYASVETDELTEGYLSAEGDDGDTVNIALVGTEPVAGPGTIASLQFSVLSNEPGAMTYLLTRIKVSDATGKDVPGVEIFISDIVNTR